MTKKAWTEIATPIAEVLRKPDNEIWKYAAYAYSANAALFPSHYLEISQVSAIKR